MSKANWNTPNLTNDQLIEVMFHYHPSQTAAAVFLALFFVAGAWNSIISFRTKSYFMLWVGVTGLCEGLGYVVRIYLLYHAGKNAYIAMSVFLVVSPTLLALTDYILVQKFMLACNLRLKWISANAIAYLFLGSDVFSLLVQSTGAAVLTNGSISTGRALLLIGLAIQLGFFAFFSLVAAKVNVLYKESHRAAANASSSQQKPQADSSKSDDAVRKILIVLYSSILLLTIRNVYRFIEFAQGYDGAIATKEYLFYVFDSALILVVFVIFSVYHPGHLLPLLQSADEPAAAASLKLDVEVGREQQLQMASST